MTEAQTTTNPDTATVTGLDTRAADVLAELSATPDTEGTSEATETVTETTAEAKPKGDAATTESEPAATDTPEARRAARKEALAALREKDAAKVREREEQRQVAEPAAGPDATQMQRELAEAKARLAKLDRLKENPRAALEFLQENEVTAELLSEYLRTGGDPAALAAKQARSELDPVLAELKNQIREANEKAERAIAAQAEREQATIKQREEAAFTEALTSAVEDFPLTAAFREELGHEQLMAMAYAVGPALPAGATYTHLLDAIEDQLSVLTRLGAKTSAPATKSPKTPAAAKAPALTNRLASGSSTLNDEELSESIDERARQVNEWLRG